MSNPQELILLQSLTDILEQLHIAYAIGGSIASSIYGKVRFTEDADITVEPFQHVADKLLEILKPHYYVSQEAMQEALRQRGSFNLIHLASAFKFDIFVRKDTAFERQLISNRRLLKLSDSLEKTFSVVSPEDIILLKLKWFLDTGCTSDRQWNDVIGILAAQTQKLDLQYLYKWASTLEINELLQKAVSQTKEFR